jgi:hypothetical protein
MAGFHTGNSATLTSECYSGTYPSTSELKSLHLTALREVDNSVSWSQLLTTLTLNFNYFEIATSLDPAGMTSGTKVGMVASKILYDRWTALMLFNTNTGFLITYKEFSSIRYESSVESCAYDLVP